MATSRKANQPHFIFVCGDLDVSTFAITNFTGADELSTPYAFEINLKSANPDIAAKDVVNKQATLYVYRNDEYFPYSGIISEFKYLETTTDFSSYSVKLVPRLWLMSLNFQTRVFQKMSVKDIVEKVLKDANLSDYFSFELQGQYSQNEYVVQYQESDLDFIARLMEGAGIWYFFNEPPVLEEDVKNVNKEKLIITDKSASFKYISGESEIVFRPASGLHERIDKELKEHVNSLSCEELVIPKEVVVKDYNYRTPEVSLSAKKPVTSGAVGSVYQFGGDLKNTDGAQKAAELTAKRIASARIVANGKSDCRGLRAGFRFTLKEHPRTECNDKFLVKSVHHTGKHTSVAGSSGVFSYQNGFSLLPSSLVEHFRPQVKTTIPRINGVITATIEAAGTDYASLDDMGRYKVRMPFDLSTSKNYDASKYVRLAQPYSGSNYGIHFPSYQGTEMVLACLDGDPNRPIGIGTVPHANTVSPVVSSNKAQNVIRTAGKNEILLDDTKDKQKVKIKTSAKNTAEFDDENKRLFVQTTDGNQLILDDKNQKASWNAKKQNITMSYKGGEEGITITTDKGHVIKIDDANKKLTIQTKGGHIIDMDDSGKKITIADGKSKNTVTLDGGGKLILDSKGEISIKAMKDLNIEAQNIKMSTTSGKIEIKATQDLNLSGMKINEKATTDFNMEGLNTNMKAQLNAKIEGGLGVDIKSNLQTKLSGTMTEVSGQAMTTVKGAIVMIN